MKPRTDTISIGLSMNAAQQLRVVLETLANQTEAVAIKSNGEFTSDTTSLLLKVVKSLRRLATIAEDHRLQLSSQFLMFSETDD